MKNVRNVLNVTRAKVKANGFRPQASRVLQLFHKKI